MLKQFGKKRLPLGHDRVESAVSPLLSAANVSFSVDAAPIIGETSFIFRISASLGNDGARSTDPSITRMGLFQVRSWFWGGGGPMVPPSRTWKSTDSIGELPALSASREPISQLSPAGIALRST